MDSQPKFSYTKEYRKQYYEANKKKWLDKVPCDACGVEISKCALKNHNKTKRHLYNLLKKQQEDASENTTDLSECEIQEVLKNPKYQEALTHLIYETLKKGCEK